MGRTPLPSNYDLVSAQTSVKKCINAPREESEYGGTGKGAPRDNIIINGFTVIHVTKDI
jgi:hypothetical protein